MRVWSVANRMKAIVVRLVGSVVRNEATCREAIVRWAYRLHLRGGCLFVLLRCLALTWFSSIYRQDSTVRKMSRHKAIGTALSKNETHLSPLATLMPTAVTFLPPDTNQLV